MERWTRAGGDGGLVTVRTHGSAGDPPSGVVLVGGGAGGGKLMLGLVTVKLQLIMMT